MAEQVFELPDGSVRIEVIEDRRVGDRLSDPPFFTECRVFLNNRAISKKRFVVDSFVFDGAEIVEAVPGEWNIRLIQTNSSYGFEMRCTLTNGVISWGHQREYDNFKKK